MSDSRLLEAPALGEPNLHNCSANGQLTVEVDACFHPFADAALLRLRSQHPELQFHLDHSSIVVVPADADSENRLRKAVFDAVYREKIWAETLTMRQALILGVMAR